MGDNDALGEIRDRLGRIRRVGERRDAGGDEREVDAVGRTVDLDPGEPRQRPLVDGHAHGDIDRALHAEQPTDRADARDLEDRQARLLVEALERQLRGGVAARVVPIPRGREADVDLRQGDPPVAKHGVRGLLHHHPQVGVGDRGVAFEIDVQLPADHGRDVVTRAAIDVDHERLGRRGGVEVDGRGGVEEPAPLHVGHQPIGRAIDEPMAEAQPLVDLERGARLRSTPRPQAVHVEQQPPPGLDVQRHLPPARLGVIDRRGDARLDPPAWTRAEPQVGPGEIGPHGVLGLRDRVLGDRLSLGEAGATGHGPHPVLGYRQIADDDELVEGPRLPFIDANPHLEPIRAVSGAGGRVGVDLDDGPDEPRARVRVLDALLDARPVDVGQECRAEADRRAVEDLLSTEDIGALHANGADARGRQDAVLDDHPGLGLSV